MYIAILFCAGDLEAAINTEYVYPFIEVLVQAIHSTAGSAVILAILIVVDLGLVIGVVAASSRMLWSFARDRGIPGWRQISKVGCVSWFAHDLLTLGRWMRRLPFPC